MNFSSKNALVSKKDMFSFLRSDPKKKLQKQYEKLLKESFDLSKTDRTASDKKRIEAEEIGLQIEQME